MQVMGFNTFIVPCGRKLIRSAECFACCPSFPTLEQESCYDLRDFALECHLESGHEGQCEYKVAYVYSSSHTFKNDVEDLTPEEQYHVLEALLFLRMTYNIYIPTVLLMLKNKEEFYANFKAEYDRQLKENPAEIPMVDSRTIAGITELRVDTDAYDYYDENYYEDY